MNPINNPPPNSTNRQDCLSSIVSVVLFFWIIFVLASRFSVEILESGVSPDSAFSGLARLPFFEGLAILIPCLILALFWKNLRYQFVFKTWAWAATFVLLLIPAHLWGAASLQAQAVWHILLSLVFFALVIITRRRVGREKNDNFRFFPPYGDQRLAFVLLVTGAAALPWLAWGALGSLLDTLLQLAAGLAFGAAAAILIESQLIKPLVNNLPPKRGNYIGYGWEAATALTIMISGLSFNFGVMQILLIITLLPLAWVWMGLRQRKRTGLPGGIGISNITFPIALIGISVSIPTLLVDSNELALIINATSGEILHWASMAARVSFLINLVFAIITYLAVFRQKPTPAAADGKQISNRNTTWLIGASALVVWLLAAGLYLSLGQPGFYGEDMFVILKSRADLSAASSIHDYTQRRQFVYKTLVEQANTSQAGLRQSLDRWKISYKPYYLVNAIELPANPLLRWWIVRQPGVDRVVDSPHLRPLAQPLPTSTGSSPAPTQPEWNLTQIGADRVWAEFGTQGEGVVVGQSDSGAQWDHPELLDTYRGKDGNHDYNWLDPWNNSPSPTDPGGHGTHTLGTVLGKHTGVAPQATWIACANLERNLGNPAYYLDCMQFMLAPYPTGEDPFLAGKAELGAMVLNNSWGCPEMEGCDPNTLHDAVAALRQAGIFVVASAGNDGPDCSTVKDPLAIYSEVLSVGATDSTGELVNFSSLGPVTVDGSQRVKPDLVAPGVNILSAFPDSTYTVLDGTSMAGPHVVGVVALVWSANPKLIGDIDLTERILHESAQPYQGSLPGCPGAHSIPSTATGYGIVDAYQAVKEALALP
jgi:hypothetical protein